MDRIILDPGDLFIQALEPVNIVDVVIGRNEATRLLSTAVCFVVSRGLEVVGYALCCIRPCICVAKVEIRGWLCNFCVADFNSDTGAGGHVSSTSRATLSFGDCCCIEGTNRAFRLDLRSKSSIPVRLWSALFFSEPIFLSLPDTN